VLVSVVFITLVTGCKPKLNERVTLWRNDQIPYGTWYAYENLQYIFPYADIYINKNSPLSLEFSYSNNDSTEGIAENEDKSAYIIIAPEVMPDEEETNALLRMASYGNHVFISSFRISQTLLDSMRLGADEFAAYYNNEDSLHVEMEDPVESAVYEYNYPGQSMDSYFTKFDSGITNIRGWDKQGRPNFVRFTYEGGGSLSVHLAPIAFTNFFLLHKENNDYYEQAFSFLPESVTAVYWDDYFRNNARNRNRNKNFSALGWVMSQPGLKEAVWLILLLLLFVYLFESKRRQKIIPILQPLKNASLDFVKTIGRLYYQRRDNQNLAQKMKMHFLDHVRTRYNIKTTTLNDELVNRLSYISGYERQAVYQLVYGLKAAEELSELSDDELMELNDKLENFQKYTT
jgi:hypothetical protein